MKRSLTGNLQELLLNQIVARYPRKADAASQLMTILSLNRDGVYRRLRGDTALTPQEIQTLAIHFQLSLDDLIAVNSNRLTFQYDSHQGTISNYWDYFTQMHEQVSTFSSQPGVRVFYATREIPFYVFMMFPRILAFKLYIYGLTNWEFPYLADRKFDFDLLTSQELDLAATICQLYLSVNSTDFWSLSVVEQSLHQIEYMIEEGRIDRIDVAQEICLDIGRMLEHARSMAEAGKKFLPGQTPIAENSQFNLYYNELVGTNNTILVTSDYLQGLFVTFDTPNFIYTLEQKVCASIEGWFDKIIRHSTPISISSRKNRNNFFNRLTDKVAQTRKRIDLLFAQG